MADINIRWGIPSNRGSQRQRVESRIITGLAPEEVIEEHSAAGSSRVRLRSTAYGISAPVVAPPSSSRIRLRSAAFGAELVTITSFEGVVRGPEQVQEAKILGSRIYQPAAPLAAQTAAGQSRIRLRSRLFGIAIKSAAGSGRVRVRSRSFGGPLPSLSQGRSRIRIRSRALGQALAKGTSRIRLRTRSVSRVIGTGTGRIRLGVRAFGSSGVVPGQGRSRLRLRARAVGRTLATGISRVRLRSRVQARAQIPARSRIRLRSRAAGFRVLTGAARGRLRLTSRATGGALVGPVGIPVKGPTRKTGLSGENNALEPLAVVYIEAGITYDDSVTIYDDPYITVDGYRRTPAAVPQAIPIGSGKNSTEEV